MKMLKTMKTPKNDEDVDDDEDSENDEDPGAVASGRGPQERPRICGRRGRVRGGE